MPDVNTHHQCGDGDLFDFITLAETNMLVRWKASPSGGSDKQQQDRGGE